MIWTPIFKREGNDDVNHDRVDLQSLVKSVRAPFNKFFVTYLSPMPRRPVAPISGNVPYYKELEAFKEGVVTSFTTNRVTPP